MRVRQQVADGTGVRQAGRSPFPGRAGRLAAGTAAAAVLLLGLAGCGRMAAALDKQWMTVDFGPTTPTATVLHVRAACSHIADTPALPLPKKESLINLMYGVRYDTTNSSPAELAELQTCLNNFKSVQGVNPEDVGDEGS